MALAEATEITVRSVAPGELRRFMEICEVAFGGAVRDEDVTRHERVFPVERQLWAFEGEVPVGTAGLFPFGLTIPGGVLPTAGVTWVGVLPSHRRRGILTRLMRVQLDDIHRWGEPLAALYASEAPIYGRFGYGLAAYTTRMDADRGNTRFREPADPAARVRLVTADEAKAVMPDIYERVRADTPGMLTRSPEWWADIRLADPEHERHGGGPLFYAALELDGRPEGYAFYRLHDEWEAGIPRSRLWVREALATSPVATREIWRYLFSVDLIARVQSAFLPVDHPLGLMVHDPRRLGITVGDGLWLRLVDLEAALGARAYASDGWVTFEVRDGLCSWNEGTWQLEVSGGEAVVERTNAKADLALDTGELASAYLGGFTFAQLRRAGRVEELTEGAIARADELFRTPHDPWCPEIF